MNLVYIIDDDPGVAMYIRDLISQIPEIVIKTFSGPEFLEDKEIDRACLFIVDILLDNGVSGIDIIKKCKLNVPTLFVSGYPYNPEDYNTLPKSLIYDFVPKPIDSSILLNRVSLLLRCGYTVKCDRDEKQTLREEIWNIFDSAPGLYTLLASLIDQKIQLGSAELLNDLDYTIDTIRQKCLTDIIDDTDASLAERYLEAVSDEGYAEITAYMKKIDGQRGPLVRWFTVKINSTYNMILSLGVPILRDHDSSMAIDRLREMFKNMCANDKKIIDVFKQAAQKTSETSIASACK